METEVISTDILIVGGGGAGLQAALTARKNKAGSITILSKVPILRSPTVVARGGIGAALGNEEKDFPTSHVEDTIAAGEGLSDRNAVETLCEQAPEAIKKLAHRGVPFTLNSQANLAQREFAGHKNKSGQPVKRACYAADRTGQLLLHTLHDLLLQTQTKLHEEHFALRLLSEDQRIKGVSALDIKNGILKFFRANHTLLATGGLGQMYEFTTNPLPSTGDGPAMVAAAGFPLQDMEFIQFHPTALKNTGILITEASRSLGGKLFNAKKQRFMKKYAPEDLELAPRDVVSQAIDREIKGGRGIKGKDYVHLDLSGLEPGILKNELPEIQKTARIYLSIDPLETPLPVKPAVHYLMGGIPTNLRGQVLNESNQPVEGLYAAGECACVSIHGANRLGTNSLAEIIVMGKNSGRNMATGSTKNSPAKITKKEIDNDLQIISRLQKNDGNISVDELREKLQNAMSVRAGIVRSGEGLRDGLKRITRLKNQFQNVEIKTDSNNYNLELIRAFEVKNMLGLAEIILKSGLRRKESRGAHFRSDYPEKDEKNWRFHTLAVSQKNKLNISQKSVHK